MFDEQKTFTATKEDLELNTSDIPIEVQRQVPEMRRISRDVSDSIQRQGGGLQLYSREQMPQVQFQSVKQNQNPSSESSEEERDTLNQAARAWNNECLQYEIREIISPASIEQAMEMQK